MTGLWCSICTVYLSYPATWGVRGKLGSRDRTVFSFAFEWDVFVSRVPLQTFDLLMNGISWPEITTRSNNIPEIQYPIHIKGGRDYLSRGHVYVPVPQGSTTVCPALEPLAFHAFINCKNSTAPFVCLCVFLVFCTLTRVLGNNSLWEKTPSLILLSRQ